MSKFMIHIKGDFYSFELYDSKGREIFDLARAIEAAEEQYPGLEYEVYNGNEGHSTFKD